MTTTRAAPIVAPLAATGTFTREDGRILVEAHHRAFVARALHPMARVGEVPVIGLQCGGGVLRGVLLGTPRAGDLLVVRYSPEPELRTNLAFQLEPPHVS